MSARVERDTMGEIEVPEDALWGAQTARAVENFPISGGGIGREMIRALGWVKQAAARVTRELGRLDPGLSEVISNRAIQLLGGTVGSRSPVHPNDHVNMGQSSNDVFPTAIHLAALSEIESGLEPALEGLQQELQEKSERFDHIVKTGRTHLQDATPIRLGQEFSGSASQVEHGIEHLAGVRDGLRELPNGGTAVGTGVNAHPEFGSQMVRELSRLTGMKLLEARNRFEAQSARDAAVRASGALRSIAVSLIKIADHIRWLGSGPRLGLGELKLPPVQPGSSIMPRKVNPVIAESLIQVAAQVIGNDAAIAVGGMLGHFQLNAMQPLIARNLLQQLQLLTNGVTVFRERLVSGIEAESERIASLLDRSLSLATALAPHIGYERAAEIAKRASAEGKTVREVALEEELLPRAELDRILDPRRQT